MKNLAIRSLFMVLPVFMAQATLADIYKCTYADGSSLFEQQCSNKAIKAEKQVLKEASNLGFNNTANTTPTPGDSLLSNGDFEHALSSWNITVGEPTTLDKEGIAGTVALKLTGIKDATDTLIRLRQCLPVKSIGKAKISAFAKQESLIAPSTNELRVVWFNNDTCSDAGQYNARLSPSAAPGWQKLQEDTLTPALGAKSLMVEVAFDGSKDTQALWDDIELILTEVDSGQLRTNTDSSYTLALGQNHLQNAEFKDNTAQWTSEWPLEWGKYSGQGVTAGVRVLASSNYGRKVKGEALSQCINFGSNKNFTLSASVKRDPMSSQTGSTSLMVYWLQEPNCKGRQQLDTEITSTNDDNWQTLTKPLTAPDGAQSAYIKAYQTVDGTGLFATFWDNFTFVATDN